jgi:hypothetical protein
MALFTNNTGFTRVNLSGAATTNSISNASASVATLGLASATTAVTFARASNTTADSLVIRTGDNATQTAITANGEETLTLTNAATATSVNESTITTLAASQLTTLNIAGLGGMLVTNAITGATNLATVTDTHTGGGDLALDLSSSTVLALTW